MLITVCMLMLNCCKPDSRCRWNSPDF